MVSRTLMIFVLLHLACVASSQSLTDDLFYTMEHDLGTGTFSNRGNIQLPGAKRKDAEVTVTQEELDQDEIHSLKNSDGHGFYRLKVNALSNTKDNTTLVMGYTCMEQMKSVSLHDAITIYSDEIGNVISVMVRPESSVHETKHTIKFTTEVHIQSPSPAPVPDTTGFLEKLREEKLQKEQEEKNPKSFFSRYWMYVLPVVFFMLMSNAGQQQGA